MSDATTPPDDGGMAGAMRLWFDMASQLTNTCQSLAAAGVSPETARQGRADLYRIWGDYWERFLRSTMFLDAEHRGMAQGLDFQKQMREQLGRLHHELQLANSQDVDQLLIGVRRIREDMSEHFEDLEARIAKLAAQLDTLAERLEGWTFV